MQKTWNIETLHIWQLHSIIWCYDICGSDVSARYQCSLLFSLAHEVR